MDFTRDELFVLWTAVTQFTQNTEEVVISAREENDTSPETLKTIQEYETAIQIQDRLDRIFAAGLAASFPEK